MISGISNGRKVKCWLHPVLLNPVKKFRPGTEFRKPCQNGLKSFHRRGFFYNKAMLKACILAPYECGKDNS